MKTVFVDKKMNPKINQQRVYSGKGFFLEERDGSFNCLIEIKSSKNKKDEIRRIREDIGEYFANNKFNSLKTNKIDLAIHLEVNKVRIKRQDLDNVQKIILDSLIKDKNNRGWNYLIEDDAQVTRILVYKTEKEADNSSNTASVNVSFRLYTPEKQMILKKDNF